MNMETKKTMQSHLDEWQISGMSVREYTFKHGIAGSTFYNWLKKSKIETPKSISKQSKTKAGQHPISFIEINTSDTNEIPAKNDIQLQKPKNLKIELVLAEGLTIKIYE